MKDCYHLILPERVLPLGRSRLCVATTAEFGLLWMCRSALRHLDDHCFFAFWLGRLPVFPVLVTEVPFAFWNYRFLYVS